MGEVSVIGIAQRTLLIEFDGLAETIAAHDGPGSRWLATCVSSRASVASVVGSATACLTDPRLAIAMLLPAPNMLVVKVPLARIAIGDGEVLPSVDTDAVILGTRAETRIVHVQRAVVLESAGGEQLEYRAAVDAVRRHIAVIDQERGRTVKPDPRAAVDDDAAIVDGRGRHRIDAGGEGHAAKRNVVLDISVVNDGPGLSNLDRDWLARRDHEI